MLDKQEVRNLTNQMENAKDAVQAIDTLRNFTGYLSSKETMQVLKDVVKLENEEKKNCKVMQLIDGPEENRFTLVDKNTKQEWDVTPSPDAAPLPKEAVRDVARELLNDREFRDSGKLKDIPLDMQLLIQQNPQDPKVISDQFNQALKAAGSNYQLDISVKASDAPGIHGSSEFVGSIIVRDSSGKETGTCPLRWDTRRSY